MNDSLIAALESMLALQRWNFLPRLETWVEAENAAYVTHVCYALGRASGLSQPGLQHLLTRSLLKSLNKHYLTDISVAIRDKLKRSSSGAWTRLVDATARQTSELFPKKISAKLKRYLTDNPQYIVTGANYDANRRTQDKIETIIRYAQYKVAYDECKVNMKVYEADYRTIVNDLLSRIQHVDGCANYEQVLAQNPTYFITIKRLKYLRRWNRINRILSTTVMGHTYLVAVLAFMLCSVSDASSTKKELFMYSTLLRALFHDVPESLTGDIITPVKRAIEKHDKTLLDNVERELNQELIDSAPAGVQDDIHELHLLEDLNPQGAFSVDSLVKDCDRLALLLECIYEKSFGVYTRDVETAFAIHWRELAQSEWTAVQEFTDIILDHWHASSK